MNTHAHSARRSPGFDRAAIAPAFVLLATIVAAPALAVEPGGVVSNSSDSLVRLLNSPTHPVPAIPIIVPQLVTAQQVDEQITLVTRPTVFQISQPTGPYADLAKVLFFEDVAVEYANIIDFRKIAAGGPAAKRLYEKVVTKPVYILVDPKKQGGQRFSIVDESDLRSDQVVNQNVLEGVIQKQLDILPTLFTCYALTADNEHKQIYEWKADYPNPGPTANWIAVLFYPSASKAIGPINRLRVLMGLERFFYAGKLRFAEVDLSTQGKVYQTVIQNGTGGPLPTQPELWVINPTTHQAVQYTAGPDLPDLRDMNHAALGLWLAKNAIPPPTDAALDTDTAWRELQRLAHQQDAIQNQSPPLQH